MARWRIGAVVVAVVVLVAATAWIAQRGGDDAAEGERTVPTSPRTLAALAVEVLDLEPDSYQAEDETAEGISVEIRFNAGEAEDGDLVIVSVVDGGQVAPCESENCATWAGDGGEFRLQWDTVEPEEDPGLYYLEFLADGVLRQAFYAGQEITGDPRDQPGLDVPVEKMQALLLDDRLGLTAPAELDETDPPAWPAELG